MSQTLGERVKDIRKRRGLSQRDLAAASGVSVSLLRKLEQGERQSTRVETARALASALRVPTSSLLANHEEVGAAQDTLDRWAAVRRALVAPHNALVARDVLNDHLVALMPG